MDFAPEILGDAFRAGGNFDVRPAARLDPRFFELSSGVAGQVMQKFVSYGVRSAVIGDIYSQPPLVHEMNRGTAIWFLRTANN